MPHIWNRKIVPGDPRHGTRWATEEEIGVAKKALADLETRHNGIVLVPAPDPHFQGHKIRVQERSNPSWYRRFGALYWRGPRDFSLKRCRVEKALRRVAETKIVRRNGYEVKILGFLMQEEANHVAIQKEG